MRTTFLEDVRNTPVEPLTGDLDKDIPRLTALIRKRLGNTDSEIVDAIVENVLPYHLHCLFSGIRDGETATPEYAALAIGEDLRDAIAGL